MTLVVIGPVTRDLVVIGNEKSYKVGGPTFKVSFLRSFTKIIWRLSIVMMKVLSVIFPI